MRGGPPGVRGFAVAGDGGRVEYRLARNAVVREVRRGRLSRVEVCDAHPELLRAARNVGAAAGEPCPICDAEGLVEVTYVFGTRLPPNGRCPASRAELDRLCNRQEQVACYVVEVCPSCAWHHLIRMFPAGGRRRVSSRAAQEG
jgi:hypothetical protein